jgi:hypothetical protein
VVEVRTVRLEDVVEMEEMLLDTAMAKMGGMVRLVESMISFSSCHFVFTNRAS